MLIWIRVLKFVFESPIQVSKHMVDVPFFHEFQEVPICERYIESLVKSMAGLSVSATTPEPGVKRRLVEIEDSDEEEQWVETPKKKKKAKKIKISRVIDNSLLKISCVKKERKG